MTSIIDDYAAIAQRMKGELKPKLKVKLPDADWGLLNQGVPALPTLMIRCSVCHGVGINDLGNRCTTCGGKGGLPCPEA